MKLGFIFILITCFCSISIVNAQKRNLIIEYEVSMNRDIGGSVFNEYLIRDENGSYYFGYRPLLPTKTHIEDIVEDFNLTRTNNLRIKFDNNANVLYEFKAAVESKKVVSYEEIPVIKWRHEKAKKLILGYNCNVATANFRGRIYEVWYTTEIPAMEGPWKLKGLPGTILLAKDTNGKYEYQAKRIILNSNIDAPLALVEYFDSEEANAISIRTAVPMENIFLNNMRSKIRSSYPVGTKFLDTPIRTEMKETEFKWDSK